MDPKRNCIPNLQQKIFKYDSQAIYMEFNLLLKGKKFALCTYMWYDTMTNILRRLLTSYRHKTPVKS